MITAHLWWHHSRITTHLLWHHSRITTHGWWHHAWMASHWWSLSSWWHHWRIHHRHHHWRESSHWKASGTLGHRSRRWHRRLRQTRSRSMWHYYRVLGVNLLNLYTTTAIDVSRTGSSITVASLRSVLTILSAALI